MCSNPSLNFLQIHGITQLPETEEYMIVMQYANDGNLLSYLNRNINRLTWKMKVNFLKDIVHCLTIIHKKGLIHCDLHGGNVVLNSSKGNRRSQLFICDLGLSQSVNRPKSIGSTIQGVLPYIAPEVFYAR